MLYIPILFGLLGGLVRGMEGIIKHVWSKGEPFDYRKILITLVLSAIIGGIVGYSFGETKVLALVAGYAGSDLLEGLYIAFVRK
ncbi:MAG: hypothetical protein QW666_01700 [Candidatus Woesearchaeota archaeon]